MLIKVFLPKECQQKVWAKEARNQPWALIRNWGINMAYSNDSFPSGNKSSLVPEIANRTGGMKGPGPCSHGKPISPTRSTVNRNKSVGVNKKDVGLS